MMNQSFKNILIASLAVLLSTNALAVRGVGNGGNVIVCKDSSSAIISMELLDYFELRERGGQLKLNSDRGTYPAILHDLFERWKIVAPKRMAQYEEWLTEFEFETWFYSGVQILPTEDTGIINVPTGCSIVPVAYQRPDSELLPDIKRYTISKDLWDRLPEVEKAGLVLHELIYREGIRAGHTTSFQTRYFNGYLASATPNSFSYAKLVQKLPLEWVEFGQGLVINLGAGAPLQTVSQIEYDGFLTGKDGNLPSDLFPIDTFQNGFFSGILGDIESEHLRIHFKSLSSISAQQSGQIEVSPERFHLSNLDDNPIKDLTISIRGLQLKFNHLPIDLSSIALTNRNKHLQMQLTSTMPVDPPKALDVDPAASFYVQADGTRIESIKQILPRTSSHVIAPELSAFGNGFLTSSGETWFYDDATGKYVKQ